MPAIILLFACAAAAAAPPPDGPGGAAFGEQAVRTREEARARYEEARRTRREAVERAARESHLGPAAEPPDWRAAGPPRDVETDEASPEEPAPALVLERRRSAVGRLLACLAAAGVIFVLLLRIFAPWLFDIHLLRRHLGRAARGTAKARREQVPITVQLRRRGDGRTASATGPETAPPPGTVEWHRPWSSERARAVGESGAARPPG